MLNDKHMMIDIETFSTRPDAVVVAAAWAFWVPSEGLISSYSYCVDVDAQLAKGRKVDSNCLQFWLQQEEEARASLIEPNPISPELLLMRIRNGVQHHQPRAVWCHATFDAPIMLGLASDFGVEEPWPFYTTSDIRTLQQLTDLPKPTRTGVHHSAADDVKFQMEYVNQMLVHHSVITEV